jgi:hypothetical protein
MQRSGRRGRPSRERIAQVRWLFASTWLLGAHAPSRTARPQPLGSGIGPVADLLSLFHEALRRLPHRLRPESYFRGQHRAAEEMGANGFGEVLTTPRAHVHAAPVQDVGGEFRVAEADVTGRASGDDVARAIDEDQRSLLRCQDVGALAVNVLQMAVLRFDDVGERNGLSALRALHLHVTPRSPVSIRVKHASR